MFRIKTMNKISPAGLSRFPSGEFLCGDDVENPEGIMVRSASLHEYALNPELKAIARAGAGVNNIPVEKCTDAGVVVFNTPGANANGVKELTIASLVTTSRHVLEASAWVKTLKGNGSEVEKLVEKGKSKFVGPELKGKKLGVIGLGAIGVMVANTAQALEMEVYGYDPYLSVDSAWGISRFIIRATSQREIFEKCDYISLHVPLTPETRGMFNASAFAGMKRGVHLFNLARGELAVADDIIEALSSGQIGSYTTDFPCDELLGVPGVYCTPHLGASTPESEDNCAEMAAEQLIDYLTTGNIKNSVNFPNAELPMSTGTRITVIHRNIPSMMSQITSCFGKEKINIDNLLNKSKKENAYTIADVQGESFDRVVEQLKAVEGVIKVRIIK